MGRIRRQLERHGEVKVATLAGGGRDGRLAVVSADLAQAALATDIAPTL